MEDQSMRPDSRLSEVLGGVQPGRIGVFRALQLGDLLCAVPALRALRAAFPHALIFLVGLPWARSFVERYSRYLDGFVEFPGFPGMTERAYELPRIPMFLQRMQELRLDLLVQLHGSGLLSNPLSLAMGAKVTTGCYVPGQFCPDPIRFLPYPESEPDVRRALRLLEFLGIPLVQGEKLEFPVWPEDEDALRQVREIESLPDDGYICIHPGKRDPTRRWPSERFCEVGGQLAAAGWKIVLTGNASESELTHQIWKRLPLGTCIDTAPLDLPLGPLAALIRRARLLICNDTGVSHLAAALRVPSVVIFLRPDLRRWAPSDHDIHRSLYRETIILPDEVLQEAWKLLKDGRH